MVLISRPLKSLWLSSSILLPAILFFRLQYSRSFKFKHIYSASGDNLYNFHG